MMSEPIHLYIIEPKSDRRNSLAAELAPLPDVTVVQSYDEAKTASGGLQAIFVSLMWAIEWGRIPIPAPLYQTRVVMMPKDEVASGRPEYAIPGVAIKPREVLTPEQATRLVLSASFEAIREFNRDRSIKLTSIGADTISLGLDKLKSGEAFALLSEAYRSPHETLATND
jgi:hypothetical protein